jgi:hypothetical protein
MKKMLLILTMISSSIVYSACGEMNLKSYGVDANDGKVPVCTFDIAGMNKSSLSEAKLKEIAVQFNKLRADDCTCPGEKAGGQTDVADAGHCSVPRSIKVVTVGGRAVLQSGARGKGNI